MFLKFEVLSRCGVAQGVWRCSGGVALLMGCGIARAVWYCSCGVALLMRCAIAHEVFRRKWRYHCIGVGFSWCSTVFRIRMNPH
jgi:hypothetical protein